MNKTKENRYIDGKKTQRSMILNIITGAVSIITSFFVTIVVTRVISLSDLGIATAFTNLKSIVTIFACFSIQYSINKMMLEEYKNDYDYLSSIYIFSSFGIACFFSIYLIFHSFINNLLGFDTGMMTLMFLMILCMNGFTIFTTYLNFKNKYKIMFIFNLLSSPVSQVSSLVLCYLLTSHKYLGRIIGVDVFSVLLGIILGLVILFKGRFKVNKKFIKDSLKISLPMIPHLLAQIILSGSDLIMIKKIVGEDMAGIYGMAYSISNILFAILIQLFNPWSPWVYRRLKDNETESIKKNSKYLTILCFYFCLCLFTVAPDMIGLFLPKEYIDAKFLVAPITIGIYFQIMYLFFYDIEYFYKKNKEISMFSVITAIINIILNLIFINIFGYQAAAYTTLASYIILFTLHYFEMRHIEKRKIYSVSFIVLLAFLLVSIALTHYIFNYNIFVRYILLFLLTIFLLCKYKDIIKNILNAINISKNKTGMKRGK